MYGKLSRTKPEPERLAGVEKGLMIKALEPSGLRVNEKLPPRSASVGNVWVVVAGEPDFGIS